MHTINSVLGQIGINSIRAVLCHEHICCFSEYLFKMAGKEYLDKEELVSKSIAELKRLKSTYGMNLFIDCTPVNVGRDIELLKKISKESGVHIVCSTGFYYTDEPVLYNMSEEKLAEYIVADAKETNAGIIKAAVENETIRTFNEKLLKATALAHQKLGLPIVLHTNAHNKNGLEALEILLQNRVSPECITVGHLSDTEDIDYITEIAGYGCYIGLDRLYGNTSDEYISKKLEIISTLCDLGYTNKIILSHDELFFNGFEVNPQIINNTRFAYLFQYILPRLGEKIADTIIRKNPIRMLKCRKD
ncbi:MAG: hypothetical protein J6Q27_03825 [Clostridia bacterium]|nr:hypothetical protein [Clostridia bacterium]